MYMTTKHVPQKPFLGFEGQRGSNMYFITYKLGADDSVDSIRLKTAIKINDVLAGNSIHQVKNLNRVILLMAKQGVVDVNERNRTRR